MSQKTGKYILLFAGFLLGLNVLAWQEVFALNSPRLLRVDFLDVGQGDAMFIETPEGHQILIDGGPGSAVLEKLAERMPFWDKSIDLVILTHPESDHMSGILEVLRRYDVDYFIWTGIVRETSEYKELTILLDNAQKRQDKFLGALVGFLSRDKKPTEIKIIIASTGERIKAGNALIEILYPFENLSGKEIKDTSNDAGVVARLVFGSSSFLFTGDISSKAEKEIASSPAKRGPRNDGLKSDVLKVAHHGSKYSTSEEFLQSVKPEFAIIEVGKNSYGHPTPEVLQRLEKFGIKVKRTDQDGDINMVSDGQKIQIK